MTSLGSRPHGGRPADPDGARAAPVGRSEAGAGPPRAPASEVEWRIGGAPVAYPDALAEMEARVAAIRAGQAGELVWLLEHPPLYTAGTSARPADLLMPDRFPVYRAGRGGQYTYHGPGQRVAYLMLDLARRGPDLRRYVWQLEEWVIRALDRLDVRGERRAGRVGLWVAGPRGTDAKIAAIGVRVRHWVTFHGVAINLAPDLDHFAGIVPCGLAGFGVTSLADLGLPTTMAELDGALIATFGAVFGTVGAGRHQCPSGSAGPVERPIGTRRAGRSGRRL